MAEPRLMALRRPDSCIVCRASLDAGTRAEWNPTLRTVTCLTCVEKRTPSKPTASSAGLPPSPKIDRGSPGASARRRYDKLHDKRERDAKQKRGRRLGGVYLALSTEPQSTRAWGVGGKGEQLLGEYLESLHDESRLVILHDRRIPGSRANIDHIAVCRKGVWAIDAKRYTGRVQRLDKGGWFTKDERLYGRRDCTKLVAGMRSQVEAIRSALGDALTLEFEVDVKAALCFVGAEWSFFPKPFLINGVLVGWAEAVGKQLLADGPLAPEHVLSLARQVATALPPA